MADVKKISSIIHEIDELTNYVKQIGQPELQAQGGIIYNYGDSPGINYKKFSIEVNTWLVSAMIKRIDELKLYIDKLEEHIEETNK